MGLSLPGLASNLDTAAIIKALMDVEAIPKTLLSNKITDKKYVVSQLQSLNSAVQNLATSAKKLSDPVALNQLTARASSDAVTVAAGKTAAPIRADIVVDRLATHHTVVTAAFSVWPDEPPVLTLENAEGELLELTPETTSPQDIAKAINAADAGVSAAVVAAGTDGLGAPVYRIQLTATESGAAGAFRLHRGDAAAVAAQTATDVTDEPGAAVITVGTDAQVRLWAGTAAEQVVTSGSNTFTNLFEGVDVTARTVSADPVTVTVAVDTAAKSRAVGEFVTQVATLLNGIKNGSTATPGTANGEQTTLGVFTGDSTVRALRMAIEQAVQYPVDGVSPSTIGISIDRYGVLSFDSATFSAAVAEDPDAVDALFAAIAARVEETATQYSDKHEGLLTARITGQESEIKTLNTQMDAWDVRLAQRRATLEATYTRMETLLSRLNSQSSYLESQLAALTKSSSSS